jgi:hypothetical protein
MKHGRTKNLSAKTIVILANYFGVSTDVFTGQPNPADIFRDIAHTIAVGEIKTPPVPMTEKEELISRLTDALSTFSVEQLRVIVYMVENQKPE